jgi:hypothetical protein
MNDNIFVGIYPCGIVYADRQQEENRDYKRLAFLSYATLELTVKDDCPDHLAKDIRAHAAELQSKRGQPFEITASGQTVTLGDALAA